MRGEALLRTLGLFPFVTWGDEGLQGAGNRL